MKKTALILVFTLICLGLFAVKLNIPEDWVDVDAAGNKIYQIQNGEIVTGFKVIGEGEPLLMVMGLGETMAGWSQTVLDIFARDYQLITNKMIPIMQDDIISVSDIIIIQDAPEEAQVFLFDLILFAVL